MFSRAHLLIEREFDRIKKDKNLHGITVYQVSDDSVFEWIVKLKGLKATRWEDGIFRLYINFNEHYNSRPPALCFHTIPFHPNVDPITGQPCIDFLDNPSLWQPSISIMSILLSIQLLLSNPVLEKAVNLQAAELCMNRPAVYNETIADCVAASQRLDMGLDPYAISKPIPVIEIKQPSSVGVQKSTSRSRPVPDVITKVSFDEYHRMWKGMATSLPSQNFRNEYVDEVKAKPGLADVHSGMGEEERKHRENLQVLDHKTLYKGRVKGGKEEDFKDNKLAEIQRMKSLYLKERINSVGRSPDVDMDSFRHGVNVPVNTPLMKSSLDQATWDGEVDDLVAWTTTLDESQL